MPGKKKSSAASGKKSLKTLAVLTSGGDAPGMNSAVRAVVRTAIAHGLEMKFIFNGYRGMIDGSIEKAELRSVGGIVNLGGTVIGTARSKEFMTPAGRKKAMDNVERESIDALVVIGGDGSYKGADCLGREFDFPTIGVPGTIDNDISGTDFTIGFDTAVNTALDAIDKIRDTATSHDRLFVIEVMGREAGFIALESGIGGGAEAILLPEVPFDLQEICERIEKGISRGKRSSIVVTAEGAGSAYEIAYKVQKMIHLETRVAVIGHMQRGGIPTALDRLNAARMGQAAVEGLLEGHYGEMVGIVSGEIQFHPLSHAWESKKSINMELIRLAEILSM